MHPVLPRIVPLLAALLLAGCAAQPAPVQQDLGEDIAVEVTATTGAIRGVVVDDAIRPIAGALVAVRGAGEQRNTTTADAGTFAFSGLDPGTYFVEVSRFGYSSVQQSVEVVAGEREPPAVKVQLLRDASQVAFVSVQSFTGVIVCTSSVVALCGAPNIVSDLILCDFFGACLGNLTDDRFGFYLLYEGNASYIQSELVWTSTQPLSTALSLQMETIEGCEDEYYENSVSGDSPLINFALAEEIAAAKIGGDCGIFHSMFSGDTAGTPLGFTLQQRYEVFSHSFYGFLPPEGWTFGNDGTPEPPQ